MTILDRLDWTEVRQHYDARIRAHERLVELFRRKSVENFANNALGINDPDFNYSAAEHGLGPKVLAENSNAVTRVFDLARQFIALENARNVPELIRRAQLKYLQISVGSEISCMVNPAVCWVANTRTIWTDLVIKHGDNIAKADEELRLYREADLSSEMAYEVWATIHSELNVALTRITKLAEQRALAARVPPGNITYLWADAIASHLYGLYHD